LTVPADPESAGAFVVGEGNGKAKKKKKKKKISGQGLS
jgi:hypothetical protein